MERISVILPTRKRKNLLVKSLQSLILRSAHPSRIEIILGIDEDDPETRDGLSENAQWFAQHNVELKASVFAPLGFEGLHNYVNHLAMQASGSWIFVWNDDAIMETDNWDMIVDKHAGYFKLLAPITGDSAYAIFPIVPKDWVVLLEHLSIHPNCDLWLSHIAYMLDIFERVDITVKHDRADITGNNNDEVFQSRKILEGNPDSESDFGHTEMQKARVRATYKLAWFLSKIRQPSIWWDRVTKGEQDPFEKMKRGFAPPSNDSNAFSSRPRVPDTEKLVL